MITLDFDGEPQRLDRFLAERLEQSRTNCQRAIERGEILVDGRTVGSNFKLKAGAVITIEENEPEPLNVEPEDIPLDILYEDEDIIVVNKARGMVVHPAAGVVHGTLVNALLYHCRDLSGINGVARPGIVHRLDKDTSGVMVVAKNDRAHAELAEQIKTKSARRIYVAIVHGRVADEAGIINGAIGRSKIDRQKMAIVEGGKPATTEFRVLERFDR
ncbi:MAG: RluA family pseudouridine synthase, partial [Selenomonadaceae bacterium]|nr:RluA family pseudouridine synthase [Selenomonadaceae bacterium]